MSAESLLLKNAVLLALDPPEVQEADLRIKGAQIAERGPGLAPRGDDEVLDLEGGLVMPGLVNAHTHLYSALARGMPGPLLAPRTFPEILERIWWRLDRALDGESVYLSGLVGAMEAARSGTTLLVDHHASPGFIRGSLATLRRAVEEVGLRSVLCYETTDRNGWEGRDRGIEENVAFLSTPSGPLSRAMVGAHASFTLSGETLDRLAGAIRETGSSLHVHVGEDLSDVEDCRTRYASGLVERFLKHGLIRPRTLLAHGVHLRPAEVERAQAEGAWIAHNPRSNMNNSVGYAPTNALQHGALGTDGMDADMLAEARAAYLKMREAGRADAVTATLRLLAGGQRLAAEFFGLPFGPLGVGGPADLVLLDYRPPTPLRAENLGGHLLFALDRSHVRSVMVAGRWLMKDRRLLTVDEQAVFARARKAAAALWARVQGL